MSDGEGGLAALAASARAIAGALDSRGRLSVALGVLAMLGSVGAGVSGAALLAEAVKPASHIALLLASAGCAVLAQALDVAKWRCHAEAEQRLECALTLAVFEASMEKRADDGLGADMQRLANALIGCKLLFQHVLFTAPTALVGAAAAALLIAALGHAWLALAMFLFAPAYLAASLWRAPTLMRAGRRVSAARIEAAARFADGLSNREIVRVFGAGPFVARALARRLRDVLRKARLFARLRAEASVLAVLVYGAASGITLLLAWTSAHAPSERASLLVLTSLCLATSMRPLELAAQAFRDLALAASLVAPLATLKADRQAVAPVAPQSRAGVHVALEDVWLRYPSGRNVLEGARLVCGRGDVVGVVGISGAGKSSLVRMLTSEIEPSAGKVLIDGRAPRFCAPIAAALQAPLLLDDTIAANIAFGRQATPHEVARAVAITGLDALIDALPEGLDARIGAKGARLSGGERQRIALARAVLKPASLYLFDEATSALDPDAEEAVMRAVIAAKGDATVIIVAHRMSALCCADRIVELRDGVFIERDRAWRASARIASPLQGRDAHSPAARTETSRDCASTSPSGG